MPFSDALKSLRQKDYGEDEKKGDGPSGSRVIQLTDSEKKELQGYGSSPGQEITCTISGKLEDGHFHVMSVRSAEGSGPGDVNADAEAVMSKIRGPVTPMQVQPSPS